MGTTTKSNDLTFGGATGTFYASPFNDVAKKYLPSTQRDLFRWCQYYLDNSPIIQQAIRRMASYPITKLIPMIEDEEVQHKAEDVLKVLDVRGLCQSIAMQYFAFGNSFATLMTPYKRFYICKSCKEKFLLKEAEKWHESSKAKGRLFRLKKKGRAQVLAVSGCPRCKQENVYIGLQDRPVKNLNETKVVLFHPLNIRLEQNPVSAKCEYRFVMPKSMREKIRKGDKFAIETSPKLFVEAAIFNQDIVLNENSIYHFSRTTADSTNGWGHPIIQGVMRELFHSQIIKKAAEALAIQHINPLMIVSPKDSGQSNIYQHLDLSNWSGNMERQLLKWRRDPNHIPLMPVPTTVDYIGGQFRSLDPTQSLSHMNEEIAMGMGVPKEFLIGGASFSSSSIALRMLENDFMNLRTLLLDFINGFLLPSASKSADIVNFEVKFSNLRTADDIQQKDLLMRLMERGKLSSETLLDECGYDYGKEQQKIHDEMKRQRDLSQDMESEEFGQQLMYDVEIPIGGKSGLSMTSPEDVVGFLGHMMQNSPPEAQEYYMGMMKEQAPHIYDAVNKNNSKSATKNSAAGSSKDKKPLPDQKPPRRGNSPV